MLHHPTLDQLRHLKLHGMARAFAELGDNAQAGELDHAQWLALLLDREEAERNDRRLTYRLRNARLRHPDACIEDVDYRAPRRLDKALFQQLTRGQWITRKQNLIITGPCGVGKSWLACALGQKAWTHPGKVEAPYTVCIASASNLTGLVKSSVECRRTGL